MNKYLSSASLKSLAKGQLLGKYGTLIIVYLIHFGSILFISFVSTSMINTSTTVGLIFLYAITFLINLLTGLLLYGEAYIFLKIACNQPVTVSDLFYGFRTEPNKIIKVQLPFAVVTLVCGLYDLLSPYVMQQPDNAYLFLIYTILFIIGNAVNILFSLNFSQCYYLMLDFPQYSPKELFRHSRRMMKGSKGRLFYIELSFLPLLFLGLCSCCITYLWVLPYMEAVKANFYLDLVKKKK